MNHQGTRPFGSRLDEIMRRHLAEGGARPEDFLEPAGEPALAAADSVSWRVFQNPVSLVIGGIAAVILELAEPRIRSGVWDHTTFRTDPLRRMRRTGAAAMITVYAARSRATRMIENVRRMHDRVQGTTPDGITYQANDPELLQWVHSTEAYGFLEAYHRYVTPLPAAERDRYFSEGAPVSALYGATHPPVSETDWNAMLAEMIPRLEPSDILREFLQIMKNLDALSEPLRRLNSVMVSAAIDLLPRGVCERLEISSSSGFPGWKTALRFAARRVDQLDLPSSPIFQARFRLASSANARS